jgi:hypothetical protein
MTENQIHRIPSKQRARLGQENEDTPNRSPPGLTNSVNFTEIRRIRSPPNFKIDDFTVHRFKIFEK